MSRVICAFCQKVAHGQLPDSMQQGLLTFGNILISGLGNESFVQNSAIAGFSFVKSMDVLYLLSYILFPKKFRHIRTYYVKMLLIKVLDYQ